MRVSDIDRALRWYRDVLGFEVVFDVELDGAALEAVTREPGARGRMIGGLVAGTTVELLHIDSSVPLSTRNGPTLGYTNISLAVHQLDRAHELAGTLGAPPGPIVEIGGVRMFFVADPDGTPIEIIEYPDGAATSAQFHGR